MVLYSSRTRRLLDAVYDWARFNTLPRAYRWILDELAAKRVSAAHLVRVTLRYGDMGTIRRMVALLEQGGISSRLLRQLAKALNPSSAFIAWDPTRPKRGRLDARWGVVWNNEVSKLTDPDFYS